MLSRAEPVTSDTWRGLQEHNTLWEMIAHLPALRWFGLYGHVVASEDKEVIYY